ncbi:hypothetical protein [Symbiopectobacterium sp. RP]|uniref:hypothetical protein n=1 Tax=Symbiopectobacterium sp. RP TaxID=3248553 RepID=UPI003D26D354
MGTSKKQKKREWLRYRDFFLSPYGVIKIKSLCYILSVLLIAIAAYAIFKHFKTRESQRIGTNHRGRKR